jgi:hypothetical protein
MLSEVQIKTVLAKYADHSKVDEDTEAAELAKKIILELGRLASGQPETEENPAVDQATLEMVGNWRAEDPGLSFWESFYSRFNDDPVKAIEYLVTWVENKRCRMKKVRQSPKRNQPKTSQLEIQQLLKTNAKKDANSLWHALRKSPAVNQELTKDSAEVIIFIDGEEVPRKGFKQRVTRARNALKN